MPRGPLVTVLMSTHNDLSFLPEAVDSILAQTLTDFEFLIVDDGSTDGSGAYLAGLRDPRVRVLRNAANEGLTRSLNRGLNEAAGRYVARMDADDVALPGRLARQVEFLEANPELGLLGTARVLIDEAGGEVAGGPAVCGSLRVRWKMLLGNAFAHPTVMLRRSALERHGLRYDESFRTAQDYELWTRLLCHTGGDNLDEPLLRYRLRAGISRTHRDDQLANHDRIAHAAIRAFVPAATVTAADVTHLRGRYGGFSVRTPGADAADAHWLGVYRDLLGAFLDAHASRPGLAAFAAEQHARLRAFSPARAA